MLNSLSTTPHIPFKLFIKFRVFPIPEYPSRHTHILPDLNWTKLAQITRSHPCRENKVTIVFEDPHTFRELDGIEQIVLEKFDLDAKGWLEVLHQVG